MNTFIGPSQFVQAVNDPQGDLAGWLASLSTLKGATGQFVLCLGSTQTSDIAGVSAAGITPEARRLTPGVDAEALILGKTVDGTGIPASPKGIVSPVVITRPALNFLQPEITIVDCGTFKSPNIPCLQLGTKPASCLSTGQALNLEQVEYLYQAGRKLGKQIASSEAYLLVSECVPGGTTTALGVLTALGFQSGNLLSSSLPQNNHALRINLVEQGLKNCRLSAADFKQQPLKAVAALGDPMQAFACGLAQEAAQKIPVLLAGGSQMLAVWALLNRLTQTQGIPIRSTSIAVVTTKWVAFDPLANVGQLAKLVQAPFAAACPDFLQSRHAGLQAYEQGNVKEGVGAGGSMAAAHLIAQASAESLMQAIDASYDQMVLAKEPALFEL